MKPEAWLALVCVAVVVVDVYAFLHFLGLVF